MSAIDRLLALGSAAISPYAFGECTGAASALREFECVLRHKNGFYAFDRALLFRPDSLHQPELGIVEWNAPGLWRTPFVGIDDLRFFAEDVFGHPFAMGPQGEIVAFDPETEDLTPIADSLEGWAACILNDPAFTLGAPIATQWNRAFGPLPAGRRLLPTTLFMLGGTFELDNLKPIAAVEAMQLRADLVSQMRDLPDGAQVIVKIVD